ncbi:Na+/xyloside symporter related transporter [Actinobacillus equuli]|nr:Na+/xyloside symporter related transporter [Actinobacillus equuli]
MSAAAGPAWFKVYAVYMVVGFAALMFSYAGLKSVLFQPKKKPKK